MCSDHVVMCNFVFFFSILFSLELYSHTFFLPLTHAYLLGNRAREDKRKIKGVDDGCMDG